MSALTWACLTSVSIAVGILFTSPVADIDAALILEVVLAAFVIPQSAYLFVITDRVPETDFLAPHKMQILLGMLLLFLGSLISLGYAFEWLPHNQSMEVESTVGTGVRG